jgi:hypothetical protein
MKDYFSSGISGSAAVGAVSTKVLSINTARKYMVFTNDSDEAIYLSLGAAAVMNKGICLNAAGGSYEMQMSDLQFTGEIYAICASGGKNLTYIEA